MHSIVTIIKNRTKLKKQMKYLDNSMYNGILVKLLNCAIKSNLVANVSSAMDCPCAFSNFLETELLCNNKFQLMELKKV
jgi:hypothetical protein